MQGLFGGYPPAVKIGVEIRNPNLWEKMQRSDKDLPSDLHQMVKERTIKGNYIFESMSRITRTIANEEIFLDMGDGGPGYGDVLERDPEKVIEDLRKEIISHRTARDVYRVAYNPETLEVNIKKTTELRQQERKNRLKRGRSYQVFEKEWLEKRPPEEALKWYGSWPDAGKVKDIIRI